MAIIDQKISQPSHEDYKVFSYSESIPPKKDDGVSMHGPAVASLLVGKSCGVAPEALLHYFEYLPVFQILLCVLRIYERC